MLLFINMIIHIGNSPLVSLPAPDLLPLEQMKMNNKKNEIEFDLKKLIPVIKPGQNPV